MSILIVASREDFGAAAGLQQAIGAEARLHTFVTGRTPALEQALVGARTLVLLWSAAAGRVEAAREKIAFAARAMTSARVLVVRLDDSELPRGLRDVEARLLGERAIEPIAAWVRGRSIGEAGEGAADDRRAADASGPVQRPIRERMPASAAPAAGGSAMPQRPARTGSAQEHGPLSPPRSSAGSLGGLLAPLALALALASLLLWRYLPLRDGGQQSQTPPDTMQIVPPALAILAGTLGLVALVAALRRAQQRRREEKRMLEEAFEVLRKEAPSFGISGVAAPGAPPASPSPPAPSAPHDIFVSYSRRDAARVAPLVARLEASGYRVWIDTSSNAVPGRFAGAIVAAIRQAKVVALMCSRHAFDSDHVVREVYVAGELGKRFVAVQLDAAPMPDDMIYFLSGFPRIPADRFDGPPPAELTKFLSA